MKGGSSSCIVIICYLLVILLSFGVVNGQSGGCQLYNTQQTPATRDVCVPFLNENIYVPVNLNGVQTLLDSEANETLWMVIVAKQIIPTLCYKMILSLICHSAFPTCKQAIINNKTANVAEPQCRSFCEKTVHECKPFFETIGQEDLLNCSEVNSFTKQEFWPVDGYYYPQSSGTPAFVPCTTEMLSNQNKSVVYAPPLITTCPWPLTLVDKPSNEESPCWVSCPDPVYTPDEWIHLIQIGTAFADVSLILLLFMVASYLIIPTKRTFPSRVQIFQFVSAAIFICTYGVFGLNQQHEVWCQDDTRISTQGNSATCTIQGIVSVFGSLSLGVWWVIMSANLFLQIIKKKHMIPPTWEKYYHMCAWGFPLLVIIICVATDSFSYSYGTSFCFMHYPGEIKYLNSIQYPIYYFPLGVYITVSATILTIIGIKILRHLRQTQKILAGFVMKDDQIYAANMRILILSFYLLVMFCWIFGYRLYLEDIDTYIYDKLYGWLACRLMTEWGFDNPGSCPSADIPDAVPFRHQVANNILMSSIGIFLFLIFGFDKTIYEAWRELILKKYSQITGRPIKLSRRKSNGSVRLSNLGKNTTTTESSSHEESNSNRESLSKNSSIITKKDDNVKRNTSGTVTDDKFVTVNLNTDEDDSNNNL